MGGALAPHVNLDFRYQKLTRCTSLLGFLAKGAKMSIMNIILLPQLVILTVLSIVLFPGAARSGENDPSQLPQGNDCKDHSYQTHLISEDPLVIYIDGFINQEEALQLASLRFFPLTASVKPVTDKGPVRAISRLQSSSQTMGES